MKKQIISSIASIAIAMNTIGLNLTANAKVIEPEIVKTETWTTSYYIDDNIETLYPYIDCQADIYNDGTVKVYFWNTHEWDGFDSFTHTATMLSTVPIPNNSTMYLQMLSFKNNEDYSNGDITAYPIWCNSNYTFSDGSYIEDAIGSDTISKSTLVDKSREYHPGTYKELDFPSLKDYSLYNKYDISYYPGVYSFSPDSETPNADNVVRFQLAQIRSSQHEPFLFDGITNNSEFNPSVKAVTSYVVSDGYYDYHDNSLIKVDNGGYVQNMPFLFFTFEGKLTDLPVNKKTEIDFYSTVDPAFNNIDFKFHLFGHDLIVNSDILQTVPKTVEPIDEVSLLKEANAKLKEENERLKNGLITGTFGDIDGNDIIDGRDATVLLTYYAKTSTGYKGTLEEFIANYASETKKNELPYEAVFVGGDTIPYKAFTPTDQIVKGEKTALKTISRKIGKEVSLSNTIDTVKGSSLISVVFKNNDTNEQLDYYSVKDFAKSERVILFLFNDDTDAVIAEKTDISFVDADYDKIVKSQVKHTTIRQKMYRKSSPQNVQVNG